MYAWDRLVGKTRRRPLIAFAEAVGTHDGCQVRTKRVNRIVGLIGSFAFGTICTFPAFQWFQSKAQHNGPHIADPGTTLALAVLGLLGVALLMLFLRLLLFRAEISWKNEGDTLNVQYGFRLFPRVLVLNWDEIGAVVQDATDAGLSSGWRGFRVVSLQRQDRENEEVHLAYCYGSDPALAIYENLRAFVGQPSTNRLVFLVYLPDGRMIELSRSATWDAGRTHVRRNIVEFPTGHSVAIDQTLRRHEHRPDPPPHPELLESKLDSIRIQYSDKNYESIPIVNCAALQICMEDQPANLSRYEINLVLYSPEGKRVNLVSYDIPPSSEPADFRKVAQRMSQTFGLMLMDHL